MKYFNYNLFNKLFFFIFLISIFFLNQKTIDAQTSDGSFPVGAFMGSEPTEAVKLSYDESGMNTIVWKANSSNKAYLQKYDVMAFNINSTDWINHYSTGCYSKWESEENQTDTLKIGVKHIRKNGQFIGSEANWGGVQCWSTLGLNGPADSLIYGPHYFQAKKYRRVYGPNNGVIQFLSRYKMALNYNPQLVNPTDPVCKIKVVYRYNDINNNSLKYSITLLEKTLTVSDFPIPNSFKIFDFDGSSYQYDTNIFPSEILGRNSPDPSQTDYTDWVSGTGIQFCVDWLGNSDLGTLYVDYAEVYDDYGWNEYISNPERVADTLEVYTQRYSNWNNIKYWYAHDEPHSIDAFVPIHVVDSLVRAVDSIPLITHFFEVNVYKNGEYIYEHFYNAVQPEKLMFDAYPFHTNPLIGHDFASLPLKLQQSYELQPGFYYVAQAFGLIYSNEQGWLKPSDAELNASVMLALAHGSKGIMFSDYYSYQSDYGLVDAIVDGQGNKSYLWHHIHDNLAPRLTGSLGNTLVNLDYTGNFINIEYQEQLPENLTNSFDYLTIQPYGNSYHWHSGFLNQKDHPENNYFLLTNLKTNFSNQGVLNINNNTGYKNLSVRDIENNSNTINTTLALNETRTFNVIFPAGEGYLFQFAPVVKYGGKLVYNETVLDGTTLYDDMTIESGATLTVNGTYNAKANITVKNGGKIIAGPNGKITFDPYKKLIVEGTTEIKGSSPINKLTLEFLYANIGIDVLAGSNLTLRYCYITGAYYGLVTRTGTPSYLNITYSNFAFGSTGIVLNGNFYGEGSSPSLTSTISGCNFTTWGTGISVSNNSSVIISQNNFTSCGISILDVPAAYIQGNNISSGSNQSYSGIFFNNSGGYIRSNTIKNRVNGIFLANSSVDIGGNLIENNYLHGIYNGSGSFPNMVGLIQTNPPTYYPLAGYNTIKNNGNDTRSGGSNDGSEIYFNYSDAHLGTERNPGCNQISDDRTSTSSMNTVLLLSGVYGNEPHFLDAIYNYWGTTTPTSSRFGIATNFTPYTNSLCAISGGSAEEKILLKTSSGIVVDTIYSAEGVPENLTTLEIIYSEADNLFATGNLTQSKPIYEQIVNANYTTEEKLPAYNKLYTIANLNGADETYFNSLQSIFNDIANTETDILLKKIYNQNAIKCDLSKQEYLTAINKFDNIIQQNPNSEEAVYAEIDIITTALNIDTTNSQLGKMGGGKYLVKGTSDYLTKLNNLLQNKFGINNDEKEQIIPKEYSLYQNYPNPFNPSTTIKFDIPASLNPSQGGTLRNVTLKVYDILGREILTLVDEPKNEGRYEVIFNASSLASGVYVYKLQAGDFTNSKKMLLLK